MYELFIVEDEVVELSIVEELSTVVLVTAEQSLTVELLIVELFVIDELLTVALSILELSRR